MASSANLSVPAAMPGRFHSTGNNTMPRQKDSDLFRAKLAEAEITQQAFGNWIDRDPRTITRWASGRENIPAYAWVALDTLITYKPNTKATYKPNRQRRKVSA